MSATRCIPVLGWQGRETAAELNLTERLVSSDWTQLFLRDSTEQLLCCWQVRASPYNSNKLTNQMQQFYKFITWRFVSLNVFRAPPRPSSGAYNCINPLNPELNPICYLLALLAHHFLHVIRIRVKSLTLRLLMSYIYGAPILDVSRSHTTTQHSR